MLSFHRGFSCSTAYCDTVFSTPITVTGNRTVTEFCLLGADTEHLNQHFQQSGWMFELFHSFFYWLKSICLNSSSFFKSPAKLLNIWLNMPLFPLSFFVFFFTGFHSCLGWRILFFLFIVQHELCLKNVSYVFIWIYYIFCKGFWNLSRDGNVRRRCCGETPPRMQSG